MVQRQKWKGATNNSVLRFEKPLTETVWFPLCWLLLLRNGCEYHVYWFEKVATLFPDAIRYWMQQTSKTIVSQQVYRARVFMNAAIFYAYLLLVAWNCGAENFHFCFAALKQGLLERQGRPCLERSRTTVPNIRYVQEIPAWNQDPFRLPQQGKPQVATTRWTPGFDVIA